MTLRLLLTASDLPLNSVVGRTPFRGRTELRVRPDGMNRGKSGSLEHDAVALLHDGDTLQVVELLQRLGQRPVTIGHVVQVVVEQGGVAVELDVDIVPTAQPMEDFFERSTVEVEIAFLPLRAGIRVDILQRRRRTVGFEGQLLSGIRLICSAEWSVCTATRPATSVTLEASPAYDWRLNSVPSTRVLRCAVSTTKGCCSSRATLK